MKIPRPAWFLLPATTLSLACAASAPKQSSEEIIGRLPAADVVLDWNAAISRYFAEFSLACPPHHHARVYTIAHVAMRDAVVATQQKTRGKAAELLVNSAVVAAAHEVVRELCPADRARFAALQDRHLAGRTNDVVAREGAGIGRQIAASTLGGRAEDRWPVPAPPTNPPNGLAESLDLAANRPRPFILKRAQQFEPEPPYHSYDDGMVLRNPALKNRKFIGAAADQGSNPQRDAPWLDAPVAQWNRVAHALAAQRPQDLGARARLFATLNLSLADAWLCAAHWNESFSQGHREQPIVVAGSTDALQVPTPDGEVTFTGARNWFVAKRIAGFPAILAALAGAAEAVLKIPFGVEAVIPESPVQTRAGQRNDAATLRASVLQCAWAPLADGTTPPEGCVAGYELGVRVGAYVLKQERR